MSENIRPWGKDECLYLMKLINMDHIDKEHSFSSNSSVIFWKLDMSKLPESSHFNIPPRKILENILFDRAFNYSYFVSELNKSNTKSPAEPAVEKYIPDISDEYYIPYTVSPHPRGTNLTTFFIKHNGVMQSPPEDCITEILNCLDYTRCPEYEKCLEGVKEFSRIADEYIREVIRKNVFRTDPAGEFYKDMIRDNVYCHRRKTANGYVDYIVNNWQRFFSGANKKVRWLDMDNGKGHMYLAVN